MLGLGLQTLADSGPADHADRGLTQAWLSLVTVELLASSEGLGFLIVWGRQLFQLDVVLSAIVVVGVVGLLLDKALALLEARLLRWRPDNTQLLSSRA